MAQSTAHKILFRKLSLLFHVSFKPSLILLVFSVLFTLNTHAVPSELNSTLSQEQTYENGIIHLNGAEGYHENKNSKIILNYKLKPGTSLGCWNKHADFAKLNKETQVLEVLVQSQEQKLIAPVIEIKGSQGTQNATLNFGSMPILLDWSLLGQIQEIVLLTHRTGGEEVAEGKIAFDLSFKSFVVPEFNNVLGELSLNSSGEQGPLAMEGALCFSETQTYGTQLTYQIPPGGIAGLWSKNYPSELNVEKSDLIIFDLQLSDRQQPLSISAEVKGDKGAQVLSLTEKNLKAVIDWNSIGQLQEVVVLINNAGGEKLSGAINVDIGFQKLSTLSKLTSSLSGRFKLLLYFAILLSILSLVLSPVTKKLRFNCPLLLAPALTLTLMGSLLIYALSDIAPLEQEKLIYALPIISLFAGLFLKLSTTQKCLTPTEVFSNIFFPGLLAITTSAAPIWTQPNQWSDLSMICGLGGASFFLVFHLSNLYRLKSAGTHLSLLSATLITGVPYLFGLLLTVQNASLFTQFVNFDSEGLQQFLQLTQLSQGVIEIAVASIGRFLIVLLFVELIMNAFSLLNAKHIISDRFAHKQLFKLSFLLILSPFIADIGSGEWAGNLPSILPSVMAVFTTVLSQGALWAFVFMITGILLDAIKGQSPAGYLIFDHAKKGRINGMVYSGILMTMIQVIYLYSHSSLIQRFFESAMFPLIIISLGLIYPLIKTIIESFDGSAVPFITRAKESYRNPILYTRGLVVGLGLALAIQLNISEASTSYRIIYGIIVGSFAFAGVNMMVDLKSGGIKKWRNYLIASIQGGFIAGGICFYLDAAQIPVIIDRFNAYNVFGAEPKAYAFSNLLSNWGQISLADYSGGSKLLYNQALHGVIGWGVAAWLFAVNQSLLTALFKRDMIHIKRLASREGMVELAEGTIRVLRWGLWMSPIIFTFLRQMSEATWYNQDGAIHTLFCIGANIGMTPEAFHEWSLEVFMWIMAYEGFRILIWLDHMGLRVATLVNLSFIGMDDLDNRFSRFIDKSGLAGSVIPEGVKRFMTWAPLLIPFYIPKSGDDWNYAWNTALGIKEASQPLIAPLFEGAAKGAISLSIFSFAILFICLLVTNILQSKSLSISNKRFQISFKKGALHSNMHGTNVQVDVTRRSNKKFTQLNSPKFFIKSKTSSTNMLETPPTLKHNALCFSQKTSSFEANLKISIPVKTDPASFWDLTLINNSRQDQEFNLSPLVEWCLDNTREDLLRVIEQRESQEMISSPGSKALYTFQPTSGMVGFVASQELPLGTIQQKQQISDGNQFSIEHLKDFTKQRDWFSDPVAGLVVTTKLKAGETKTLRFLIGCGHYEAEAVNLVKSYLPTPIKK